MPFDTIAKPAASALPVAPNISDYDAQRGSFSWEDVAKELDGLPGGGINIAYEAVDRHVAKGHGARTAFVWAGKNGEEETYTFEDLYEALEPVVRRPSRPRCQEGRTASSSSSTASLSSTPPSSAR